MANSDAVIATGDSDEDAVILKTAGALAQYPGPIILRWFWEFNVLENNQVCRGDQGVLPHATCTRILLVLGSTSGSCSIMLTRKM